MKTPSTANKSITANKTINIVWTDASRVRMTARVDMPEYGLAKDQVFYLIRSSANDGTYYIVKWSYERIAWQCSCPARKPCRHEKKVANDCKGRINKKEVVGSLVTTCPQDDDVITDEPEIFEVDPNTYPPAGTPAKRSNNNLLHVAIHDDGSVTVHEVPDAFKKAIAESEKEAAKIQAPGLVQRPRVDAPRKESAFKKEFDALRKHREAPRKRNNQGFELFR